MNGFDLDKYINTTQDFPKKGILFRDISPLLENHKAITNVIDIFEEKARSLNADLIAGIESRGFLFSTLLASRLEIGSFMIRKPGKLSGDLIEKSYSLEYGESKLSIQKSKNITNKKVIIICVNSLSVCNNVPSPIVEDLYVLFVFNINEGRKRRE